MECSLFSWLGFGPNNKELKEDALKNIYHIEKNKQEFNLDFLAGKLNVRVSKLNKILDSVIKEGLFDNDKKQLTEVGRRYALKIIRKHRLYEKYLSEHSGYPPEEWHDQACKQEHYISDEAQEKIAQRLGNPKFDPHGDPIPSGNEDVEDVGGQLISAMVTGDVVRVMRVRDWPKENFKKIQELGIMPKSVFRIEDAEGDDIIIYYEGEIFKISNELIDNLIVEKCNENVDDELNVRRLYTLDKGEEAEIVGISKCCTGVVRRRLLDLGFVRGSHVAIDLTSPMGNPVAYVIRGTAIALRRDQARYILIKKRNEK